MVLLCFSALLPASADAGSLSFDKMLFYESGQNGVERSQRVYANRFPKSAARYINGEVNFVNYSNADESHKLLLKYYKPDGSLFEETAYSGVVKSRYEWATAWMSVGLGWETPNNYLVGRYRVDAYLDGAYVAQGYFEIYDDKTAQTVPQEDLVKYDLYGERNGQKTYDLYYDKVIRKTQSGTILLNVFHIYTSYGKEIRLKDTPGFPPNATVAGTVVEVDVSQNRYRVLITMYSDSKGYIISEIKHDNPQWYIPENGTMAGEYFKIAGKLSGR